MVTATGSLIDQGQLSKALDLGHRRSLKYRRPILVSYSQAVALRDPVAVFEEGRGCRHHGFFWSQPNLRLALVGIGAARVFEPRRGISTPCVMEEWERLLEHAVIADSAPITGSGPILCGGFAFDPLRKRSPDWEGFSDGSLVLPEVHYVEHNKNARLTLNLVVDAQTGLRRAVERLLELACRMVDPPVRDPAGQEPQEFHRDDLTPVPIWMDAVRNAAAAVRIGHLKKVVLARGIRLDSTRSFAIAGALERLRQSYRHAYCFAVSRGPRCFLGATPERLVRLRANTIETAALAGTTGRGASEAEDRRLGKELLKCRKNRAEHAVVVEMLCSRLRLVCDELRVPGSPKVMKLPSLQHLFTPIAGRLRRNMSLLDLVAALHPTPALGGLPQAMALAYIRAVEPLDRGWFAGPVGWLSGQAEGEFAVAIRSALIEDRQALLFAGCGIMADSDPRLEHEETELKLRPMLAALRGYAVVS